MPLLQHVIDTYASEVNKVSSVWHQFADGELDYRPHSRSSTVGEIMQHELLSGRPESWWLEPRPFGPTADVIWKGADPTRTVQAPARK